MNIKLNTELKLKANSMLYNKSRTCTRVGLSSNNNKKKNINELVLKLFFRKFSEWKILHYNLYHLTLIIREHLDRLVSAAQRPRKIYSKPLYHLKRI